MRVIIQRVSSASVSIGGEQHAAIGRGLLLLVGIHKDDSIAEVDYCVSKISSMRILPDTSGHMNMSIKEAGGAILVISQFTLFANTRKGNRPSFIEAAPPVLAAPLYESFCAALSRQTGLEVKTGVFGANMQVSLLNDGPVTIVLDSK
jgi:D-tyrosyl-tRNA(Tyr) deacylase